MGPRLDDKNLFECRPGVPILDVHTRGDRTVDPDRLNLIVSNSNARAQRGDYGLMFIGHTQDGIPEKDQPPLAGYLRNYRMGEHRGKPCILADLMYDKSKPQAFEYPRRSVEVYYSERDPKANYIDALALLKTSPERDLGLVTYAVQGRVKERYSMADSNPSGLSLTEADLPALTDFMQRKGITDTAQGVKAFLAAKADGTDKPGDDEFTQADIAKVEQYAKTHKIDTSKPGGYNEALHRYKKDRREGKLERY